MGSKLYREIGEKLPSICPGITIRQFQGEVEYKQVDDSLAVGLQQTFIITYSMMFEDNCRCEDLNLD